ncbi:MATE family efflux transporter [Lacrimispora amygdalina]|uniref:MATE family efflux transporter n=1 Tax=Lacrimispora amygdalina TaxID=253257 RepID=A0A3E2NCK5_9FIRM|nr:MATE family efflux transporter [Clostridium indicum]RFZ78620.1 MATE family efflux transporter [Clostridium indicum]
MQSDYKSRVLDMTKGSPFQLLLYFSLPLFFGNLLQQLYSLADTSIAGHLLGDGALAQIGATAALYSLITNFAFGLNNGLALTVSKYFGAGEQKEMKQAVCWMVSISCIFAVFLTAGFLLLKYSLLSGLQIPEDTLAGALSYFTIILAGIPLTMAYNLEFSLLQAVGNSFTPLLFLLFSSVLNVGLDFLFMGSLAMGVQGAATATVLAQGISAVLCFFYIVKNYRGLHFHKKDLRVKPEFVLKMLWTGLSMALMSTIYNIGSVVLQSSINALGSVYIAAQMGARRLAELFYNPGLALAASIATYSSQNYGANCRSRITKGIKTALLLYGVWWLFAVLFTFLFAENAVKLITGSGSQEVVSNAVLYLQISIPMIPPMALLVIIRSALQGMGRPVLPLLCSVIELIGKVWFSLWAVPVWGYIAVCVCEPVLWVICALVILTAPIVYRREFA